MKKYKIIVTARNLLSLAIFALLLAWVLSSCEQHDLCYDHGHNRVLRVRYDWAEAEKSKPKSMFLYMYPDDGGEVIRRDWAGWDGGNVSAKSWVPYDVTSYNSDNPNLLMEREQGTSFLTTRQAVVIPVLGIEVRSLPVTRSTEEMPYKTETDSVWIAASDGKVTLGDDETTDITLKPRRAWVTLHVVIRNVENWGKIGSGIAASLSGMCGGVNITTGQKTRQDVIIPFAMHLDKETASMEGTMTCFGPGMDGAVPNKLMVFMTLKNGSKWSYVFDVTSMVRKEEGASRIEVDIEKLTIPNVAGGNGGMQPGVSDWNIIDIPILM